MKMLKKKNYQIESKAIFYIDLLFSQLLCNLINVYYTIR